MAIIRSRAARLALCAACPHFTPTGKPRRERCGRCGCLIRAKAAVPWFRCPLKKW
jgi:hypothetical protein